MKIIILTLLSINLFSQKIEQGKLPKTSVEGVLIEWSDYYPAGLKDGYKVISLTGYDLGCEIRVRKSIKEIYKSNPDYKFIDCGWSVTYIYPNESDINNYNACLAYKRKRK